MLLDFSFITSLANMSPEQILFAVLYYGGWIPLAIVFLWGMKEFWKDYINGQWLSEQKFIFLAIDIPRGNEVSLRSVENMFTYFAGAHGSHNLIDTYWIGAIQLGFSFEIVSIDGYTQFLIRTPASFRNLVESAVYSTYPDAEITEINDYTENIPSKFPDSDYDIWGTEFMPVKSDAYPFKTYPQFYDQTSRAEMVFKDPLASLLDLYSSMRPGEQMWMQILLTPTDYTWNIIGEDEVKKIMKEKTSAPKENPLEFVLSIFITAITEIFGALTEALGFGAASSEEAGDPLTMIQLKPREKKQVEAIQEKMSKNGFKSKIRMIYVAKKDIINKAKAVNGFVGYMKQFVDSDLNSFKPDMDKTATSTAYFFKDYRLNERKNKLMRAYKARDSFVGRTPKIFSTEELATLWHFPFEATVRAPLIQKVSGKRSEPPMSLPFDMDTPSTPRNIPEEASSNIFQNEVVSHGTGNALPKKKEDTDKNTNEAPSNLPFI